LITEVTEETASPQPKPTPPPTESVASAPTARKRAGSEQAASEQTGSAQAASDQAPSRPSEPLVSGSTATGSIASELTRGPSAREESALGASFGGAAQWAEPVPSASAAGGAQSAEAVPGVSATGAVPSAEPVAGVSAAGAAQSAEPDSDHEQPQMARRPDVVEAADAESDRPEPWAKLIADPGHAPEILALAAVESFGPRARDWLDRTKHDYPAADQVALARLATTQFTRAGGLGSIFGAVAGSYAPIALLGTAAVAHAELILHVAAAYGLDPLAPERAVDLLVLTRVHPDRAGAEAALAAARRPAYDDEGGVTAAVWRLSRMITTRIGGWGVVRLINRYLPGVSLLTAFLASRAAAESVAARANAHYRRQARQ
jgi:hypothetical protein